MPFLIVRYAHSLVGRDVSFHKIYVFDIKFAFLFKFLQWIKKSVKM